MKKLFSFLLMGVFILTSVSVFTSCKDNDDDIKAIRDDVAALRAELTNVKAALETELQSSKSSFETQIAQVKKELQDAIDKKADEATVSSLREKLTGLETDYLAKVAVLETQIETANKALSKLDDKADKATVDNVIANLAALTGQLSDESKAREAVEANLAIQVEALNKLKKALEDADYQGQIDKIIAANYQGQINELIAACENFQTTEDAAQMKKTINNLELQLNNFNQYVSALTVLVERQLNSISLVPQLFVNGIEAIEFTSLKYNKWKGNFNTKDIKPLDAAMFVSNGETEATYRLNPTTVQLDGIDVDGIDFYAATAEARETRPTRAIEVASPVTFNGIKSFKNGLMTVFMKKINPNVYLGDENADPITIVALKVPRNAAQYEAADIISENSRLLEKFYYPRIASIDFKGKWDPKEINAKATEVYLDDVDRINPIDWNLYRPHHYSDSITIYNTRTDFNSPDALDAKLVYYQNSFDLKTIVTGCLLNGGDYDSPCAREAKAAELKKYGMVFRYYLATAAYIDPQTHNTDEQRFASVTVNGIISPKLPEGRTDNKAIIGKEPIVRIELVDTVNNQLVDRRYLKIKWTDKAEPTPDPVKIFDYTSEAVMNPCDITKGEGPKWLFFIEQVYANLKHHSGMEGLSENMFREIWDVTQPIKVVTWTTNWPNNYKDFTSAPNAGSDNNAGPDIIDPVVVDPYKSPYADANIGEWILTPDQIKTVYCSDKGDTKTFHAKVTFKSKDRRYPDIYFNWDFLIKLPTLPEIVGYYDQYWLDEHKAHDILPLQFNTDMQKWWATMATTPKTYCFFDNNLMNPFVYDPSANSTHQIVKNIPACGSWDMQFAYKQSIQTANRHQPNYEPGTPPDLDSEFDTGNGYRIWKSGGYEVETRYFSNPTRMIDWQDFGAYQYWKIPFIGGQKLLQMTWKSNDGENLNPLTLTGHDVDYPRKAWNKSSNIQERRTYLYADHYTTDLDWRNDYYKDLLNELDPDPANDLVRADGTKEPKRTHTKPLDINIWGALNAWNYIPVKSYKAYMIAPLRFNYKTNAIWHDGQVNGSPVNWRENFTLTDFRGYLVADVADNTYSGEQQKWTRSLWNFYEVQPYVLEDQALFAFELKTTPTRDVVINNDGNHWMTRDQLYKETNGNIDISFERQGDLIYFWNNSGSRIEADVRVRIPVSVRYGLGKLDSYLEGWVYPHEIH